MTIVRPPLGLGIGWRPELALLIARRPDLTFVEVLAEDLDPHGPLPRPIEQLRDRGVTVVPHGVSLSLGSADPPDPDRLSALARLAERLDAPLVSEHLAFVRAGGIESGHLLPLPRTAEMRAIVVANIRAAQRALPVPLAIENIASLFDWPEAEMDEPAFLAEVIEQAGVLLLLDLANVHANTFNRGGDPIAYLEQLPLNRIAYIHVAGGVIRDKVYHDTHAHRVGEPVLSLVEKLLARVDVPGILLERDDHFPADGELHAELDAIKAAIAHGEARRRNPAHVR
jgi:hypothetical protein